MGMKERTRERRGEIPQRVGGVKREDCSRPHLRDHTTAVHKVGETQTCRVFLLHFSILWVKLTKSERDAA